MLKKKKKVRRRIRNGEAGLPQGIITSGAVQRAVCGVAGGQPSAGKNTVQDMTGRQFEMINRITSWLSYT